MVRNPELHRFLHSALSGEEPESQDIFLYHYEDRVINIHSSTLFDAAGKPIGILSVLNDVTRLRRLENIRRDFAANVSHELKTPLTAIAGFVETLRNGAFAQPEKAQQFFAIIEKHVERLSAIIDDLMELSKIEQKVKNRQIELSENEIENLVWSAREICLVKAAEKNIDVQINCQNGLNATINPQLLEQAVVNLLDNAIKYSPPGSQVLVTAEQLDSFAVIRIQDKGPGIEKKHLSRIFERFYRVDKARSRKIGGTGLGLAIVKHIAQAHNGTVEVESTPGKGSVFSIQLPPKIPK
jgi:two-component system phosphate regulon sensor histidine kinase PhoR